MRSILVCTCTQRLVNVKNVGAGETYHPVFLQTTPQQLAAEFKSFGEIDKPRISEKEKHAIAFVTFRDPAKVDEFFSKPVTILSVELEMRS